MKMFRNSTDGVDEACDCADTWIAYWREHTGQDLPVPCANIQCANPARIGALVTLVDHDTPSGRRGILPLCHTCKEIDRSVILHTDEVDAPTPV